MAAEPESPSSKRPGPVRLTLERRIEEGEIAHDAGQRRLADRLDALDRSLSAAEVASKKSSLGWLFGKKRRAEPVHGLYVYGDVGRGKTMIMDMFYRQTSVKAKRRAHFHAFMGDVHERIGAHRQAVKAGTASGDDPIPPVAKALAAEARLLCFDEFAVTDVADAMILSRLFKALFAEGVVLVATSNVAPDGLYKDGLNRGLFTPFIDTLKAHADVFELAGAEDYRMEALGEEPFYVFPLGPEADRSIDAIWKRILGGQREETACVQVKGRTIEIARASGGAARLTYDEALKRPLGAQDYLALAERFRTIVLEGVPVMDEAERNEARRFIALVDALYDTKRRLIVSADAPAEDLYRHRSGKEAFEFQRTVSRLHEMRSDAYVAAATDTATNDAGANRPGSDGSTT